MLNDLKTVLQSRAIVLIILTSAIMRLVFFLTMPNSPSKFGPDEGTYAFLAKYVSESLPVQDFPLFGPDLYHSSKTFIIPSAFFIELGMNQLDAVRLTSSLYGLASLILLSLIYLSLRRTFGEGPNGTLSVFDKKSTFLIWLFALFPSNFMWSIIGLRESGSQFWLLITFYFLIKVILQGDSSVWIYSCFSILSLMLAFGTRPETALVFSIVVLFFAIFLLIKNRRIIPAIVVAFGLLLGQAFTASKAIPPLPLVSSADTVDLEDTFSKAVQEIQKDFGELLVLEDRRNINALNAESAIKQTSCINQTRHFLTTIKCNLLEFPYRLFTFLFRPLLFFDQGSTSLTLAAIENLGWALLILYGLFGAFRRFRYTAESFIRITLGAYILVFSSAAALYEGNLGTAFRHKSSILWPLLLTLLLFNSVNAATKYSKD